MSLGLTLPASHRVRGEWAALNFYPLAGSEDRLTVAVLAVGANASYYIATAPGLKRLHCLFGEEGAKYVEFIELGIESLRRSCQGSLDTMLRDGFTFGGSVELNCFQPGSGDSLQSIAESWLQQVSLLGCEETTVEEPAVYTTAHDATLTRGRRIMPAIRDEMATMSPFLVNNFGSLFRPAGKALPVRIGYKGNRIVADFGRLTAVNIGSSLDKVRGKLWTLSEHRTQTEHEGYREHEMLVIRKARYLEDQSSREISILDRACDDLMAEADRRNIRFRHLPSPREAAQHLFRAEMADAARIY